MHIAKWFYIPTSNAKRQGMGHQNSSELALQSDLHNFLAQKALKEKIMSYPDLNTFINPILTALKSIMRSWHYQYTVRAGMVQSFYMYLYNYIPIVSIQTQNSFKDYLNTYWFLFGAGTR